MDCVKIAKYEDFKSLFENITSIKTQLTYLTFGDISLEQAKSSTGKLASLIKVTEVNLKESAGQKLELPANISILYSLKSPNIYEKQGVTLVMYEFNKTFLEEMTIYSYCAYDVFFDYLRTKRGSGYTVKVLVRNILDKTYLLIYSLGKVYSPEQMDRFINEALIESFSFDKCKVDLIRQHLKNVENIEGYAGDKFEMLKDDIHSNKVKTLKEEKKDEKIITYQSIIEKLQDIVIKNPKRIAILYHRADLTDEELDKQNKELDENYLLNPEIKNIMTTNITYLGKYLKAKF
jgi:secreted Zn-dependent insulinase-like peptidase